MGAALVLTDQDRMQEVISRAKRYMQASGLNNTDFAKLLRDPRNPEKSMDRSTLHKILNNQHQSRYLDKYLAEITRYLDSTEEQLGLVSELALPSKPGFIGTNDTLAVLGVCKKCHRNGEIGVIAGKPGYGKSYALQRYAKNEKTIYLPCGVNTRARDILRRIETAINIDRPRGSIEERVERIAGFFKEHPGYLIIFDDAHWLLGNTTVRPMATVQNIFEFAQEDQVPYVGIVLAGESPLEPQLKRLMGHLADRVGTWYQPSGLSKDEVDDYLKGFSLDPEARRELHHRALNKENGSFRRLNRTVNNMLEILQEYPEAVISLETVQNSGNMLMR